MWSERHGIPVGSAVPIAQVQDLGREWYGHHCDRNWRKWSVDEAIEIFDRVGLVGAFWGRAALPVSGVIAVFSLIYCEKLRFPRYLDVGLIVSVLCSDGGLARPSGTQTKDVLKGIARVDDPFGARWSA